MPRILKVKDDSDKFHKAMPTFDIPFKLLINGKSQLSGKTTIVLNLLLNPQFGYADKFDGEDIYIISDNKLEQQTKDVSRIQRNTRYQYYGVMMNQCLTCCMIL